MTYLRRSDFRQELDRPTDSVVLRYRGRGAKFDSYLYGYPEDVIFAVELDDVPWPEDLEDLAEAYGVVVDALPDARRLREAVADSLVAEALVGAPRHMEEMGASGFEWRHSDLHEVERRHQIADARVRRLAKLMENDLRLRVGGFKMPSFRVPDVSSFVVPQPPLEPGEATLETVSAEALSAAAEPLPEVDTSFAGSSHPVNVPTATIETVAPSEEAEGADEAGPLSPSVVTRVAEAIKGAREAELPQRLPGGARARLRRMPAGTYLAWGEALDYRADLCSAMTDGRALGRKGREVSLIDWDSEWPVVARRWGQGGRVVYKVETALRRYAR